MQRRQSGLSFGSITCGSHGGRMTLSRNKSAHVNSQLKVEQPNDTDAVEAIDGENRG